MLIQNEFYIGSKMKKIITIVLFILVCVKNFAQTDNDIQITWIDTQTEVAENLIKITWGIKASSQITDVVTSLNGIKTKGINAVTNDGYDMRKTQEFNLKDGENNIEIVVTTLKGNKMSTKNIFYKKRNDNDNPIVDNDFEEFECLDSLMEYAHFGHSKAQYLLGKAYLNGINGLSKDVFESSLWFKKAAEKSYPPAEYQFSISLFEGRGIYKNVSKALSWLNAAVNDDYAEAQLKLGILYETGKYVGKDIEKAKDLYRKCPLKEAKERLENL